MAKKTAVLFFVVLQVASSLCAVLAPVDSNSVEPPKPTTRSLTANCDSIFDPTCLKLRFVSLIESISEQNELTLYPGIALVKESTPEDDQKLQEIARNFNGNDVDNYLAQRVESYLETHTLKMDLAETARSLEVSTSEAKDVNDSRGLKKKKKKKLLALLFLAGGLIKAIVGALFKIKIFLLAKKALLVGVAAVVLSVILFFKVESLTKSMEENGNGHGNGYANGHGNGYATVHANGHGHDVHGYAHHEAHAHGSSHDHGGFQGYARSINFDLPEHLKREEK